MKGSISEVVAAAPLYRDLSPDEIAELAGAGLGGSRRRGADGPGPGLRQRLCDGVRDGGGGGALPGGGKSAIANWAGRMVGDMGLLMRVAGARRRRGRGATWRRCSPTALLEAALHLLRPASLKVLRRSG